MITFHIRITNFQSSDFENNELRVLNFTLYGCQILHSTDVKYNLVRIVNRLSTDLNLALYGRQIVHCTDVMYTIVRITIKTAYGLQFYTVPVLMWGITMFGYQVLHCSDLQFTSFG